MPSLIPCHAREAAWARREWSVLDMDLLEPCGEKCIISKSVKNFSTMMTLKKMFWHVQLFITATVILLWPNRCRTWSPWTWCNLHYLMQGNQCRADQIRSVTAHHEGSDQTRQDRACRTIYWTRGVSLSCWSHKMQVGQIKIEVNFPTKIRMLSRARLYLN